MSHLLCLFSDEDSRLQTRVWSIVGPGKRVGWRCTAVEPRLALTSDLLSVTDSLSCFDTLMEERRPRMKKELVTTSVSFSILLAP